MRSLLQNHAWFAGFAAVRALGILIDANRVEFLPAW
jgi:hypothetical protein